VGPISNTKSDEGWQTKDDNQDPRSVWPQSASAPLGVGLPLSRVYHRCTCMAKAQGISRAL